MSVSPPSTTSPTSRKRSHDEVDQSPSKDASLHRDATSDLPTPPAVASVQGSAHGSRQGSPVLSVDSSVAHASAAGSNANKTPSATPAAKKRKLTFAEKEVKRFEKEQKEREKADEKGRKDEEKRFKEEEKEEARRKRELEKAEKQKAKDAKEGEKRKKEEAKEEEKRKKDEEKAKKDKSQMRLGAFFKAPSEQDGNNASSRRGSSASLMSQSDTENVGAASPQKQGFSDFRNTFQPFYVGRNMKLAPINYFGHDKEAVDYLCSRIDDALQASDPFEEHNKPLHASDLLRLIPHKKPRRIKGQASVRDIMAELEAEREQVIDLTGPQLTSQSSARQKLSKVPTKILFYHRDERPAYHGTFTRPIPEKSALKLTRNPFERAIPSIEYDYDSEAEWEPPAEGDEDLNSDEEDVGSEEGEEDMEDFLDDEEDSGKGRIVGDMRPRCSGLRWADEVDNRHVDDEFDMNRMRLEIIADSSGPIDPYSTAYWEKTTKPSSSHLKAPDASHSMNPPRLPLQTIPQTDVLTNKADVIDSLETQPLKASPALKKPGKMISDELLPAFKQAVEGSNLTQVGLIEVLKKQFPKVPKGTIKVTLIAVAKRVGTKEVDKKWTIIN